jgi:cytochrome P450
LLDADLPDSEKSTFRLTKEGFTLVAAGGDTTGSTISLLIYHLTANLDKLARLRTALSPLFEDSSERPSWTRLEEVPYMTAVVKEGLRMNQGVTSRLPRCAPDRETRYKDIVIPRGTPVSMSIPDIHENPDIFPEPKTFLPERWLMEDVGEKPVIHTKLDRWLVPFTKGNRQCLGMK